MCVVETDRQAKRAVHDPRRVKPTRTEHSLADSCANSATDKRKEWEDSVTGTLPLQLTHGHLQERSSKA